MNVVIFGRGLGKPRQINLSGLTVITLGIVMLAGVGAGGFAVGYQYSFATGSGVSAAEYAALSEELDEQRATIATIRRGDGLPREVELIPDERS